MHTRRTGAPCQRSEGALQRHGEADLLKEQVDLLSQLKFESELALTTQ